MMTDQPANGETLPKPPQPPPAAGAAATGSEPAEILTPEEQMARFEKELKENDWGHQPC